MSMMKLVVKVDAHFDWLNPPATKQEEALREQANVAARSTASRLEQAVQLLVLEILSMKVDSFRPTEKVGPSDPTT